MTGSLISLINTTCFNNICFSFCFCPIIISQGSTDIEIPTLPTKKRAVLEAANRFNECRRYVPLRCLFLHFETTNERKPCTKSRQSSVLPLGLSTTCSRFFKKFLLISQKVAQKLLKKQSKVTFCNESCSKVARKNKTLVCSDAKTCKLYNKSKISKHSSSVQFCGVTSVAK